MHTAREVSCHACLRAARGAVHCADCEQVLCAECDVRLHASLLSIRHLRSDFCNEVFVDRRAKFSVFSFANVALCAETLPGIGAAERARALLVQRARGGELLLDAGEVATEVAAACRLAPEEVLQLLERDENLQLSAPLYAPEDAAPQLSLLLPAISVESLVWALRSIKRDRMQPSEALLLSRLKQCFGLRTPARNWRGFVEQLQHCPRLLQRCNRYKRALGELSVCVAADGVVMLQLVGESWRFEDVEPVAAGDEAYAAFLAFIARRLAGNAPGVQGGKFGCALFAQREGPPELRGLSLGRLSAFVRQALAVGMLRHDKTLIVAGRDGAEPSRGCEAPVRELQHHVLQLLAESGEEGVMLAQLPFLLAARLRRPVDLQRLGFPKLKDFLRTLDDRVQLQQMERNYIRVVLRCAWPATAPAAGDPRAVERLRERVLAALAARHGELEIARLEQEVGFAPAGLGVDDFQDFLLTFCHEKVQIAVCRDRVSGKRARVVQALFPPPRGRALSDDLRRASSAARDRHARVCSGFEFQVISPIETSTTDDPSRADAAEEPVFDTQSLRRFSKLFDADDD